MIGSAAPQTRATGFPCNGTSRACEAGEAKDSNYERVRRMNIKWQINSFDKRKSLLLFLALSLLVYGVFSGSRLALAAQLDTQRKAEKQTLFSTPEQAMKALVDAAKAKDRAALAAIFGANAQQQLLSGDQVQDNHEMDEFAAAVDKSAKLEKVGDAKFTLTIGEHNWPFPIPIVKEGAQWRFDTQAGTEEILNRRIGENELSAILTCRAYVLAQWQYFTEEDEDKDSVAEYAQNFVGSPGKGMGSTGKLLRARSQVRWAALSPPPARKVTE